MSTPAQAVARLRVAAASGRLDALCEQHGIGVLTVFGSAARAEPDARDLDVGVLGEPGRQLDPVAVVNALSEVAEFERVDLADLDRAGPVLRERALVGCIPLYERTSGRYAAAQTAAIAERIETDAGRRLELELLQR